MSTVGGGGLLAEGLIQFISTAEGRTGASLRTYRVEHQADPTRIARADDRVVRGSFPIFFIRFSSRSLGHTATTIELRSRSTSLQDFIIRSFRGLMKTRENIRTSAEMGIGSVKIKEKKESASPMRRIEGSYVSP